LWFLWHPTTIIYDVSRVKHTPQVHPILEPQEGEKADSSSNSPIFSGKVYHNHQQTSTHPPIHPPAVPDKQVELELDPRTHLVDSLVAVNPVALAHVFRLGLQKREGLHAEYYVASEVE